LEGVECMRKRNHSLTNTLRRMAGAKRKIGHITEPDLSIR
jgi:hypothetical protein